MFARSLRLSHRAWQDLVLHTVAGIAGSERRRSRTFNPDSFIAQSGSMFCSHKQRSHAVNALTLIWPRHERIPIPPSSRLCSLLNAGYFAVMLLASVYSPQTHCITFSRLR